VDTEGRWGDFFEAALLDNIDDEWEAEEENAEGAASNSNIDRDNDDV
jgi:hypothetical protein